MFHYKESVFRKFIFTLCWISFKQIIYIYIYIYIYTHTHTHIYIYIYIYIYKEVNYENKSDSFSFLHYFFSFPSTFLKNSNNAFIIFQSVVFLRNWIHFKHHCLCQSHNSFQKRTPSKLLLDFLSLYILSSLLLF